jgi:hypothetical protein
MGIMLKGTDFLKTALLKKCRHRIVTATILSWPGLKAKDLMEGYLRFAVDYRPGRSGNSI